ncbi:MAG TPA: hypothetical protein PLC80_13355 [Draconibacterium sp.]|nr:hypothetical protein [Draconibacterium sp.]
MRHKFTLTILCLAVSYFTVNAKVWTVDNNAGASADYSVLQNAIDKASAGDTLYVTGSPNYYDGSTMVRLNKKLILIGPGFFLGENSNTQSSNQTAKIYSMEIGEGADNSLIMGLDFYSSSREILFSKDKRDGSVGSSPANNVVIKRNLIESLDLNYASGTVIEQNYFYNNGNNVHLDNTCSNTLIQNNIMNSGSSYYATIYGDSNYELSNTVVKNNTLSNGLYRIHAVEISNNIFITGTLNDCDKNTVKNNVFVSAEEAIPTESTANVLNKNIFSVTASELFVEATQTVDNDYILSTDSPAKGAGIDGIDAGAFGGLNPYKLSGLSPIPSIYELTTNGIGTLEEGIKVTIKAKSNN